MPSKEEYLEDLREFADELGKPPTKQEMNDHGPHSTTPYYTRWGSWNDALEAAGLGTNHREVTKEELLEDMRRVADEHGEPVRCGDIEEHGTYDPSTYFRHFESWFDAREQAGLNADDIRPGRRSDEDALTEAVRELAMELGRPPSQSEMNDRGEFSITPYIRRWGSWDRALEVAGLGTRE